MRLDEIDSLNVIDLDRWQEICDVLCRLAGVRSAAITRLDLPYIEAYKVSSNADSPFHEGLRVELARHYCEEVVRQRDRVQVTDARESTRWNTAPELGHSLVSYLGYPLQLPDGDLFGTLCIHDDKPNDYSEDIDTLMQQFRALIESHFAMARQTQELNDRLAEIHTLRGIIPICAECKKVRDDAGYWQAVESYVARRTQADFSHGICPECFNALYPDMREVEQAGQQDQTA